MEAGFDFATGQVAAGTNAAPLTSDATIRCERLHLTNLGSTVVYLGKSGVTVSGGYGIVSGVGEVIIEYSGFVADVYCIASGTQTIHWLAIK
jgi:hypothetical protein